MYTMFQGLVLVLMLIRMIDIISFQVCVFEDAGHSPCYFFVLHEVLLILQIVIYKLNVNYGIRMGVLSL